MKFSTDVLDFCSAIRVKGLAQSFGVDEATQAETLFAKDPARRHVAKMFRALEIQKGAVAAGGTLGGEWGSELLATSRVSTAISDAVRARSVISRLDPMRVGFDVALTWLVSSTPAVFVEQHASIPVGSRTFAPDATLRAAKLGSMLYTSRELLVMPGVEELLARELIASCAHGLDLALLNPDGVGADATPASLVSLSDVFYNGSGATTPAAIDDLLTAMAAHVHTLGSDMTRCVWILPTATCIGLAALRTAAGGPHAFPTVNAAGGELLGMPIIASGYVPAGLCVLIDAAEVLFAEEPLTTVSLSNDAMIDVSEELNGSVLMSVFQVDATAFKVIRYANWRMRNEFIIAAKNLMVGPGAPDTTE